MKIIKTNDLKIKWRHVVNLNSSLNSNLRYGVAALIVATSSISCSDGNVASSNSTGSNAAANNNAASIELSNLTKSNADTGDQWAFMNGFKQSNQYGVYVGQGTAGGLPGTRTAPIAQTDNNGKMWLFGGSGYAASGAPGELNDLWRYDTKSQVWTWINGSNTINSIGVYNGDSADHPGGRSAAASWMSSDGKLWVFGGQGYDKNQYTSLNDLWQYDPKTNVWKWVSGSTVGNQVGVYSSDSKSMPGSRGWASSWMGSDGKLWLFGGYGFVVNSSGVTVQGSLNDLWQYDPSGNKWTWVSGSSTVDQHGVYGNKGSASSSNVPGARSDAVSWVDKSGNLWLFGGFGFSTGSNRGLLNDLWKYNTSSKQWTWISGSSLLNQSGNYGIKGAASANSMPGSRETAVAAVSSSGLVLLFGGNGVAVGSNYGYLNDVWQYDMDNNQWAWIGGSMNVNQAGVDDTQGGFSSSNTPGGRGGSISFIDQNSHLWVFGGYGFDSESKIGDLGDLWQYIPSTVININTWTWMSGSNKINDPGVYSGDPSTYVPSAKSKVSGAINKNTNVWWLFGGYMLSQYSYSGEFWQYDLYNHTWTLISAKNSSTYGTKGVPSVNNYPGSRYSSSAWVDKYGKFWLFGGSSSGGYCNDLWLYDPNTKAWTWIGGSSNTNQAGTYGTKGTGSVDNIPGARYTSTYWTDKNDTLWLFGGSDYGGGSLNDLWKYDYNTKQWTWMSGESSAGQKGTYGTKYIFSSSNTPGARTGSTNWIDESNNLWLFGGDNTYGTGGFGDLWEYSISTKQWAWMGGSNTYGSQYGVYGIMGVPDANNIPAMRYGAVGWTDKSNNLWLFGGSYYSSYLHSYLNDLWRYNINTRLWTWMGGSDTYNQLGIYGALGIPSVDNIAGGRLSSVGVADNSGTFWMFGGYGYPYYSTIGYLNDLWKYVPPSN